MAQVDGNDHDAIDPCGDGLPPSYDPRGAFAWTLRGAEIARRKREAANRRPAASSRRRTAIRTWLARA
jgi:hypothetical protein